jgi:hypothetical protein
MNYFRRYRLLTISFALLFTFLCHPQLYALDSTFMRNGEVYLSISGATGEIQNGIYRLSDPEGALGSSFYPRFLFLEPLIRSFAVDINRNVFTLSDPTISAIGSNFILKRQVLDDSEILMVSPNEGKYPKTHVTDESPTMQTEKVSEILSDWGYHQFIHTDHRSSYGGVNTNVYRTVTKPTSGTATRKVKRSGSGYWTKFEALQGNKTDAPTNPNEYLPNFAATNQALVLPHYPGKLWYEVPNGAWYSAWRAKAGVNNSIAPSPKTIYYQCYRDHATGQQFDWRMVEFNPKNNLAVDYKRTARSPFATTYSMSFTRAVLAGCLDGCGGSSGSAATSASAMVFDAAFMPFSNSAGKPDVTIYSYSRTDGTGNYALDYNKGNRSFDVTTFGNGAGIGKYDTQWIGVSKGPTATNGKERDFVYYLGTSQIQAWIPQISNQNITAVSVSNQWDENGGIIFAFNKTDNQIIRFKLHPTNGTLEDYTTINVSTLMKSMHADSSIDDIAADGFGNLYISLTYPSSNPNFDVPKNFGWTYNDATSYTKSAVDSGDVHLKFTFKVDYRKSVRKVSAMGEPLEEVGSAKIATREYYREVTIPASKVNDLPPSSSLPNSNMDAIIQPIKSLEGSFIASSLTAINTSSKLAIINAPTPPEVKSLGGNRSYLDIIGAYREYPTPDKLNHSTRQDQQPRSEPSTLNLSTLYYFMVENYPLPEAVQNPNVNADYDKDGRRSGFVSTIINAEPTAGKIRYIWNLWMVRDHQGKPCIPPNPSNPDNSTSSYFSVFYSPIPARYVLTCKVEYDWYDYNTVKFGQTIKQWEKDFGTNGGNKTSYAFATGNGLDSSGIPVLSGSKARLTSIVSNLFADYTGSDKDDSMKSIVNTIYADDLKIITSSTKYKDDPNIDFYMAVEGVIATGTADPVPDPTEVARVQRCNPPSTKVTAAGNWHPTGKGVMDPSTGYHGIAAEQTYYWRLDVASQSIFFEDLTNATAYKFLADKLTNKDEKAYFVNAKNDFRFRRNNEDLRWDTKSELGLEATLRYPTANKTDFEVYPLTGEVKEGIEGGKKFRYFELKAGTLPPTDPYIGELSIKLNRMFYYDMYIFDDKGNQLMKNPITLPKMLTIEGKTNVMVIDSTSPTLIFSDTSPNQLYGETGKLLANAGNGQSANKIAITMTDNNPWEAITSVTPHPHSALSNIAYNQKRIENITTENAEYNLKPVFNNLNRYFRVYYEVSDADATKKVNSTYTPGWGIDPATVSSTKPVSFEGITASSKLVEDTSAYNKLYTNIKLSLPLANLTANGELRIPSNYANNTPSYQPLKFYYDASDSSGNVIEKEELNVILHIKDTIRPMPFGEIVEFKNNNIAYIPSTSSNLPDEKDKKVITTWYDDFKTLTRRSDMVYDKDEDNLAIWSGNAQTAKICNHGSKELYSLPYINSSNEIVSLKTTKFHDKISSKLNEIAPGNIEVEDNVEILIKAGAVDNAGAAMSQLTLKYFDINGSQRSTVLAYPTDWNLDGVRYDSTEPKPTQSTRLVFREHVVLDNTSGETKVDFPLGIPIIIEAKDNAKEWDTYKKDTHGATTFSWGNLTEGALKSNTRTFKTTLPVYGTKLEIRTIDKYHSK